MLSLKDFISQMPKAELHVHIEGTLTPSLVIQLADRNNVPVPETITSAENTPDSFAFYDLSSFLAVYYSAMLVLLTSSDFYDLAWSYFSKAHSQNVVHVEVFFDPQAHTSRGVPFDTVITGLRRAVVRAERELSLSVSLIMCFLRDMEPGFAMATLMESLPYKDWIIGVGLDSDERDNPPAKFAHVFKRAKAEGYLVTCHCDIDQKNSIEHIRQALVDIEVDRLDHGTNIVEDETLIRLARDRGVGLTCCPLSNSVVTSDFKGKEMLQLLRAGVRVTINSDDPAYFRGYMNENLSKMASVPGLTRSDFVQFQRNAFEISWIQARKCEKFVEALEGFAEMYDAEV